MPNCIYYQARVDRAKTWFVTATLRSFEHLCFDRTIDKEQGIFEFFVPEDLEKFFLEFMGAMAQQGLIADLIKLSNRLEDPHEKV